jgi:hypothetical protein
MREIKIAVSQAEAIDPAFNGCFIEESNIGKFKVFPLDIA